MNSLITATIYSKDTVHANQVVTSVTYLGNNFTFDVAEQNGDYRVEKWHLVGMSNLIDITTATLTGTVAEVSMVVSVYLGVDQATPIEAVASNQGTATNPPMTVDITTTTDFDYVEDGALNVNNTIFSNTTEDYSQNGTPSFAYGISFIKVTPPALQTMSWSWLQGTIDTAVINDPGSGYIVGDTVTVDGGNNDGQLQVDAITHGNVLTVSVNDPGTGYSVSDVLTLDGGLGDATVEVTAITGGGGIDTINLLSNGNNYNVTSYLALGGTGTGGIINVDTIDGVGGAITSLSITNQGFTYSDGTNTLSGGTGEGATADITITNPTGDWIDVAVAIKPATSIVDGDKGSKLTLKEGAQNPILTSYQGTDFLKLQLLANNDATPISNITLEGDLLTPASSYSVSFPDKSGTFAYLSDVVVPGGTTNDIQTNNGTGGFAGGGLQQTVPAATDIFLVAPSVGSNGDGSNVSLRAADGGVFTGNGGTLVLHAGNGSSNGTGNGGNIQIDSGVKGLTSGSPGNIAIGTNGFSFGVGGITYIGSGIQWNEAAASQAFSVNAKQIDFDVYSQTTNNNLPGVTIQSSTSNTTDGNESYALNTYVNSTDPSVVNNFIGIRVKTNGSTAGTNYGIKLDSQAGIGAVENAGLFINDFGTGSDDFAIKTNGGKIYFGKSASAVGAILDTENIASSDKTFTFPNETGTFALGTGVSTKLAFWNDTNTLQDTNIQFINNVSNINLAVDNQTITDNPGIGMTISGSNGDGIGDGGSVNLQAGISTGGGTGGALFVGGGTQTVGGAVTVQGGNGAVNDNNGGSVILQAGAPHGSGAEGHVFISNPVTFLRSTFDNSSQTDDRTFTFPDQTGILVATPDPGADTLYLWDDTDGLPVNATIGSGLSYDHSSHTLSSSPVLQSVSLTGQVADIADTAFTVNTPGLYRISYYLLDTTADITAGAVTLNIKYTDSVTSRTLSSSPVILTATTGFTQGNFVVSLDSGDITYGVTSTGIYGTSVYAVYLIQEKL